MSLWTLTATAQEPVAETTSPVATETDSLQRVVDDLSQQLRHQKNEELDLDGYNGDGKNIPYRVTGEFLG